MSKYQQLKENVYTEKVLAAANKFYYCIIRAIDIYRQKELHRVKIFIPCGDSNTKTSYDYFMGGCFDYVNNYYVRKLVKEMLANENIKFSAEPDEVLYYDRYRRIVPHDNGYIVKCKF